MKALFCSSLLASAFIFAATLAAIDHPARPHAGTFVDVGRRNLYLNCTGHGAPTVVLESGAGSFSVDWALVQPEIAKTTRVCSYDRAGYGWSDPGPEWDTVGQTAQDLQTALTKAGERAPYLLVGQSMGGLFVRWYQHEHPAEVVGLVLVDTYETAAPLNGKQVPLYTLSKEQLQATLPPPSSLQKPPIPTAVRPPFDKLPQDAQQAHLQLERHFFETIDFNKGPVMMESWRSAFYVLHNASLKQDSLNGLPIVILTRDGVSKVEEEQQQNLLRLSRNAHRVVATHSGHFIQVERPDLVIDGIQQVLRFERASTR